ncbi:hypothetical protein [Luteibacter sp. CQ10]|uniref:GT99 family glycosyltransferase N-terminal domain-containing protein n=1 Tax=Luteibacter sp. CQ10 TaxID=2805821 RepID=UPI0034A1FD53
MIAAFLPPYAFRGLPAPYLWVFYRLLHSATEPMAFLLSADYLTPPAELEALGRPELDLGRQRDMGYSVPDVASFESHVFRLMDDRLMARALPEHGGNPLDFFRAFLQVVIPELREELVKHLRSLPETPEVILSWCNCPSLESAAADCGIRVAYMEMGPLREPMYRGTAYLDFTGVNGNTEARARFEALEGRDLVPGISLATLRRSMMLEEASVDGGRPRSNLGIVLQVEDDSNLICYGNGFDNISLIARGLFLVPKSDLLVRPHPGSRFELRDPAIAVDPSPSSAVFVQQCARVMTINSSVGLEALMYGVPVEVLGDSSYAFIAEAVDERERLKRLAFYLFAYLVPFDEVFAAEYIRFRLGNPTEDQIVARHAAFYFRAEEAIHSTDRLFVDLDEYLDRFKGPDALVDRQRRVSAPREGLAKLYFRGEGEEFSEERALECHPVREGAAHVARFRMPVGARPVTVRFDPASAEGIYVLSAVAWADIEASAGSSERIEVTRLYDFGLRILSFGDRLISEPGRLPVKILSSSDDPFIELAVGDLWAEEGLGRAAILEFRFHVSEGQRESIHGFADLKERLERMEAQFGSLSGVLARIEERIDVLGESRTQEEALLRAVKSELDEVVNLTQRKRKFW